MLKPITVVLTAAGSPGASTCIRYLKSVSERQVRIVGVDADREAIGRFLSDDFRAIPPSTHPEYIDALLDVVRDFNADCLIPASSYEVNVVAASIERFNALGVNVLVSDIRDLEIANDKGKLYSTLRNEPGVRLPDFRVVRSLEEFLAAYDEMGGASRRLCFKPSFSKGSRGFRYLDDSISRRDLLLNYKPDSKFISLAEFREIFRDEPAERFPELLLMEVLEGEEIDSMVVAMGGECLLITHKTRERERGGVITLGEQVLRPEIDESIRAIIRRIPLKYNFGIQFIGGALLEINPRLSTFMYAPDWVEPYFAIKLALGEYSPDDVRAWQARVPIGLRMVRYFDQHFFRG